jgi:hypothetical protein
MGEYNDKPEANSEGRKCDLDPASQLRLLWTETCQQRVNKYYRTYVSRVSALMPSEMVPIRLAAKESTLSKYAVIWDAHDS